MNAQRLIENISDANRVGVELQLTDAKTALTFLDLAETTGTAESRSRRTAEAHSAYQSILHFLPRLTPTAQQMEILSRDLRTIKTRLQAAGISINDEI